MSSLQTERSMCWAGYELHGRDENRALRSKAERQRQRRGEREEAGIELTFESTAEGNRLGVGARTQK